MLNAHLPSSRGRSSILACCLVLAALYAFTGSFHRDKNTDVLNKLDLQTYYTNDSSPAVEPTGSATSGSQEYVPEPVGYVEDESEDAENSSSDDPSAETLDGESLTFAYDEAQSKIQDLRKSWVPPSTTSPRWPPYNWYENEQYDPNLWEGFDWDNRFYFENGIKRLPQERIPFLPYPDYSSHAYRKRWAGTYVSCVGARGHRLNESAEDVVYAYSSLSSFGFPKPAIGSAEVIGIPNDVCFDRVGRFRPYGYLNDYERTGAAVKWDEVSWGQLQRQCLNDNRYRFPPNVWRAIGPTRRRKLPKDHLEQPKQPLVRKIGRRYHHRTAVLVRVWSGYEYTDNVKHSIRALITEASLRSGGEYQVHLLAHIKDVNTSMWHSNDAYQAVLRANVPEEFHGIAVLWNAHLLREWYPKIGNWSVYWHQFMPVQWFSKTRPQFDYVWNWEVDARYTGNYYQLFQQLGQFAKGSPRKYLWERNARFYIPSAHGSYKQWLNDTEASVKSAVHGGGMKTVWGPQPYSTIFATLVGPAPPFSEAEDDFEWGVGEEADLITLQPIWNPTDTDWSFKNMIWNYIPGVRPLFTVEDPLARNFDHPELPSVPRRTFINTNCRLSKKQLHAMHIENYAGRTMQAEMWPATVALHHGLKAVYAPHPIWTDRRWPAWYMDAVFNADGNRTAHWASRADSVYNHDREHNFAGWSWYFDSGFARALYRRWLGWSAITGSYEEHATNPLRVFGGKEYEDRGVVVEAALKDTGDKVTSVDASQEMVFGGNGRMCLPPMLLHPVKNVYDKADMSDTQRSSFSQWFQKLFGWQG